MIIYGTRFCGKIHEVDGQSIITKFGHLYYLIMVPFESWFITGKSKDGETLSGYTINMNWKSVAIAYGRWIFGALSILGIFFLYSQYRMEPIISFIKLNLLIVVGEVLALTIFIASLLGGKTKSDDQIKRQVLGIAVGVNAFPEWLLDSDRKKIFDILEANWITLQEEKKLPGWKSYLGFIETAPTEYLPMLYALSSYQDSMNGSETTRKKSEEVWKSIIKEWIPLIVKEAERQTNQTTTTKKEVDDRWG